MHSFLKVSSVDESTAVKGLPADQHDADGPANETQQAEQPKDSGQVHSPLPETRQSRRARKRLNYQSLEGWIGYDDSRDSDYH